MTLDEQRLELERRGFETPSYIVIDATNNTYYFCFTQKNGALDTEPVWKITKTELVGLDWQVTIYKDAIYNKVINNGTTRLATLQGYSTGWINYSNF